MRRVAVWAVVGTTVAWAATTALFACSSDTTTAPIVTSSSSSSSSSGDGNSDDDNSSSSSSSSSSGSTDAGTDAATDAASDAGASDPKQIACGAAECAAVQDQQGGLGECCWPNADATKAICATTTANCNSSTDYAFACDEAADCFGQGNDCFFGGGQSNCSDNLTDFKATFGFNSDDGNFVQLCKTDAECTPAATCAPKSCKFGTAKNGDQVTINLRVCGAPTNCQ